MVDSTNANSLKNKGTMKNKIIILTAVSMAAVVLVYKYANEIVSGYKAIMNRIESENV